MRALAFATRWSVAALLSVVVLLPHVRAQAEGTFRWVKNGREGFAGGSSVGSSPVVSADGTLIYVGATDELTTPAQGRLLAINRDGTLNWKSETLEPANPVDSEVFSSPAIGPDGMIYVGSGNGKLYALNPVTHVKEWSFNTNSYIDTPVTIGANGTIYVLSGDFVLHAISPVTHAEKWHHAGGVGFNAAPAIAADGTVYISSADGTIFALNPEDGFEKWRTPASVTAYSTPAIASDGTIYFTSYNDGRLLALSPLDGVIKWTFSAGAAVAASPVIGADGTIYFGDMGGVFHALNPDGTLKWPNPPHLGVSIASTAAVRGDGVIIFGAHDSCIHALNPDGAEKWKTSSFGDGNVVLSSPVIAPDGSIYVGAEDGKLHAINGNGSPLSTVSSWPMFHGDTAHTARARVAPRTAYLVNLSTYAQAGGTNNLIAGFVIQGQAAKKYLVRGVGPTLSFLDVPGVLPDPAVSLFKDTAEIAANDNWTDNAQTIVDTTNEAHTFQLGGFNKDAALAVSLPPAKYSAVVKSSDGQRGVALVEVYDAERDSSAARLINLSTRAQAGGGASVLTAGLVIGGQGSMRLLLRAIGPGLTQFGVTGVLAQPKMTVFSAQTPIGGNTGWTSGGLIEDIATAARLTGAFPLSASGAGLSDCATVMQLTPGDYTIQVTGVGGTAGEALVEVYVIP